MHFDIPFKDKNSERLMLSRRIAKIISYLESEYLVTDTEQLGGFYFRDGQYTFAQKDEGNWVPFDEEKEFWGYPECYAWFKHSFEVPARFAGKPVVYEVMPYRDNKWAQTNPQLIIYANGKILQGMDSNHRSVRLLDNAKGGEKFEIYINAHTDAWEFKTVNQMKAKIMTVDDLVTKLVFDLKTPLEVANLYGADDMPRVEIIKALNEAVNILDLNTTEYEVFAKSAKAAMDYLAKEIYGKNDDDAVVSCIGHTHIDVAWLWRLRQTREKTGRSFQTVLKLMEEYPEYKFMSSQAQLYEYVKQDYPDVYEGIKQRVKEGRWEIEGSMWVESDTNVVSGESLVRQFLVGKRFFKNEFGVDNKIMWLPDVFGYTASLPQIMKKSGIDYFMTTKISWNEYNKVPYDTFNWEGIDGTKILSHFSPSTDNDESRSFMTTYNAFLRPSQIIGGWKRYSQKDLNKNVLCTFGHGDGGGGPTKEMLEYGRRIEKGIPGCPKIRMEFARDYFENLKKDVADNRHLPTWAGELYLEFHRGTLTAQAENKYYNRKSENLYHDIETLSTIANLECGKEYPSEQLLEGWKIILLNQFHDIIPGSSIKEVYEDSKVQYEELVKDGKAMLDDTLNKLVENINVNGNAFVVFNTLGTQRDDVVITEMPPLNNFSIVDETGTALPWQKTHDGKLAFFAKAVPAKGYKVFEIRETSADILTEIEANEKSVNNRFFEIEFDDNMNISKLVHKQTGRNVAPEGEVLNKLIAYEDRPAGHDAWDINSYFTEKYWEITNVEKVELIEKGPVRAVYLVERKFQKSHICQKYIVYADIERIDVQYVLDWKDSFILLKSDFPVDVNTKKATFDIQFGNIERNTHNNTTWDFAQFEVLGHKWADLSDNSFGLSILNDCKYGHTVKDGHIMPSLLRCATLPHPTQDQGIHHFTYSIYPHAGHVSTSDVVAQGYSLNFPMYCKMAQAHNGVLPEHYSLVSVDCDNIIIETIKKAEDSDEIVIRAYETWNKKTNCTINLGKAISSVYECNLIEENEVELKADGNQFAATFKPFEIKSFKVKF